MIKMPPPEQDDFLLESYDYELPQKNIAQHPAEKRDSSKLLTFDRHTSTVSHGIFSDIIRYFKEGDILVVNDTRVFPARLQGKKVTGGKAEVFLLELPSAMRIDRENNTKYSEAVALIKSSKRPAVDTVINISDQLFCRVVSHSENGRVKIELGYPAELEMAEVLSECGSVPLPPYIERVSGTSAEDRKRYQTVYAENTGAVAAPTAGLHFTNSILENLQARGVDITALTLHVGYGTFAPVRSDAIKDHQIHSEFASISAESAKRINRARKNGGKVWAVGTTTVRALEYFSDGSGFLNESQGWCDLYIMPGFQFRVIDNLITNFHLPKSSLLFLVSALCGRKSLLRCYREAINNDYRFYSYGDAMAILS